MHFFDGFRTSHEVNKINLLTDGQIRAMIDDKLVYAHRQRGLNPDKPFIRGTAQNPDVYFQARETVNPYYSRIPEIVQKTMDDFGHLTGRNYKLYQYYGDADAERIIVIMASGAEVVRETVIKLTETGEKVGVVQIRLYRPFSAKHFLEVLPETVKKIAVLDRTKEPGSIGEPFYQDVLTIMAEAYRLGNISMFPQIVGGRYGLSSKEFTPGMAKGVFDELKKASPKNSFTVGIIDDVSHSSIAYDPAYDIIPEGTISAIFFGLGSDGTVGANKNSIKIIGEGTGLYAQGYFVYDSKKSGTQTVSHLRFGPEPLPAPYLIRKANFLACHKFTYIGKVQMLRIAGQGATFLLNSPYGVDEVWDHLPLPVQEQIVEKKLKFYVIDGSGVAQASGLGTKINTIMQACFFALSGILPKGEAIERIKNSIRKTYGKKGKAVVEQNFRVVDATLENLHEVKVPARATGDIPLPPTVPAEAPEFVQQVTAMMMRGDGDELPVSKLPVDGTYPSATTRWEKRNLSDLVAQWEKDICIQCGNCSFVCPHSVIRSKFYNKEYLEQAPEEFPSATINARGFPETRYTLQVYVEDCTGCNLCVEVCPVTDPDDESTKAINLRPRKPILQKERENIQFFESLPMNDRDKVDFSSVRGTQFLEPLFEFSGACAGCGETPYIKVLTQLFGDRLIVANATGCSSIYGGNQPTTPWATNKEGRGPAWSNSLFEDNAEFGLGMRITADNHLAMARGLVQYLSTELGEELADQLLDNDQLYESEISKQSERVAVLKKKLTLMDKDEAKMLLSVADHLVRRSVWLVGGDGWAYDIGSGGLDHVLSTGRNVNVLVLDTEVYSNTGGQMSKATPTAATAKFAAAGKKVGKKDLALQAISYGNVYVAQVAMGANPQQTLLAMREAEAYPGPSIILAYSQCIAHGIDMQKGMTQQKLAVDCGHWPLLRYNPTLRKMGKSPFVLDSPTPTIKLKEYAYNELRYRILTRTNPEEAERLMKAAQELVDLRWKTYVDMSGWGAEEFSPLM